MLRPAAVVEHRPALRRAIVIADRFDRRAHRRGRAPVLCYDSAMDAPAPPPSPPRPWVIYALIAANLIAFGIELAAGASPFAPTAAQIVDLGGNAPMLTLHGEWWRLGAAMFLHFGLLHIGLNLLCLWQARAVEALFGHLGLAVIYLVAGLAGGIASLGHGAASVSAGASGAVFGVYGAFGAFLWLRRAVIPAEVWSKTARQMATFLGLNLIIGFSTPGIDMSAHLGGIAAGFALGALLLVGARAEAQRTRRSLGLLVVGVALTAIGLVVIPAADDPAPVLAEFEQVEQHCIDHWNQLQAQAGVLADAALADQIEREVLVPWRQLRVKVEAIEHPPARLERLFALLRAYLDSRQRTWEAYASAARTRDAERAQFLAEYKRVVQDADADAARVKLEIAQLTAALPK
jgi:rhomboid protease GluP